MNSRFMKRKLLQTIKIYDSSLHKVNRLSYGEQTGKAVKSVYNFCTKYKDVVVSYYIC